MLSEILPVIPMPLAFALLGVSGLGIAGAVVGLIWSLKTRRGASS